MASLPTLSISDAERRAYHNRRVSDARYPQRIFDTLWILVRSDLSRLGATLLGVWMPIRFSSLVPRASYLSPKIIS